MAVSCVSGRKCKKAAVKAETVEKVTLATVPTVSAALRSFRGICRMFYGKSLYSEIIKKTNMSYVAMRA